MDEKKREELLIRIDERTKNISKNLTESEDSIKSQINLILCQQKEQNGSITKALELSANNASSLKWVKGTLATVITALLGLFWAFVSYIKGA